MSSMFVGDVGSILSYVVLCCSKCRRLGASSHLRSRSSSFDAILLDVGFVTRAVWYRMRLRAEGGDGAVKYYCYGEEVPVSGHTLRSSVLPFLGRMQGEKRADPDE